MNANESRPEAAVEDLAGRLISVKNTPIKRRSQANRAGEVIA